MNLEDKDFRRYQKQIGELEARIRELEKERDKEQYSSLTFETTIDRLRTTVSTLRGLLEEIHPLVVEIEDNDCVRIGRMELLRSWLKNYTALSGKRGEGLQADIEEATHALMEIQAESQQKTEEKIALRARVKELEGGRRDVWREVVGVLARARDLEPDAGTKALISALLSRARKEVGENVT
jgi:chromosome segregation ATPase